ncbi:MAG: AAA family ATPase [Sphingomonadaceae bacterium]
MGAAQNITRHFGGDWHGSQGAIPAPGHSKADRSVTVKDADNGDVVFHSFTDADWKDLKDECRRVGLLPEFEPTGAAWRETGVYQYRGYRTVRLEKPGEKKRFVAQRPDGKGGWINGLGDIPRVLYRADEVEAADISAPVYLVEGERKADKLASWGLIGTAVAFGAKGWKRHYADALAGRTVVILPDNDDEGRGFAERAKADLESAGSKAVILTLPGLPTKGDIIDWSANGHSAFDLKRLTEDALTEPAETFELADLALWARTTPTPKAFVMAPFIPREDVVIVTGDGGTNKSTLALQISACAAAGKQMLGMDVTPGPALYVTAEDDDRENHWRLVKIAQTIGTTLHALAGRLHIVSLRGRLNNEIATFDNDGKLRPAPAYRLLRATIVKTGAKLVTLDNVAHLFAGNENDRSQVTAFINLLYRLCGDLGVTILLIAHRNKVGDSYSGSTAWLNAVRSQILMERSDEADPDIRRLSLGKANYARQGEELAFRWHDFALVRDEDLPAGVANQLAATARATAENAAFMRCLAAAFENKRAVSHNPGSNYAPKVFAAMAEGKAHNEKAFAQAMERLLYLGQIELDAPLWRGPNRVMKQGIKAAETAPTPLHAPPAPTCTKPAEMLHASTPLIINNNGAATRAAAPSLDHGQPVDFPADDPDDWADPVHAFERPRL